MLTIARWIIASPLAALFIGAALANWSLVLQLQKRTGSMIPLVGGIAGLLAVFVCPSIAVHRFWYVPLVADLGCAPLFLYAAFYFPIIALREKRMKEELSKRVLPPEVIAGVEKFLPAMFTETAQEVLKQAIPDLHLDEQPRECTRVLLAVIRRSNGDIARLEGSVRLARRDWRDLLVSAGLADDDWEKILEAEGFEVPPV